MQMLEAKRLISEGGRPYIRRVKGNDYITVKIGRKERGFGRYNEKDWLELLAHYDIVVAQQRHRASEASGETAKYGDEEIIKVDKILARSENIHEIFQFLEAGYTPQQIIAATYYPWWEVEACAKKYKELEKLYGRTKPQPSATTTMESISPSYFKSVNEMLDEIKKYVEKKLKRRITPEELRQFVNKRKLPL